ncbi:uncharacterized protein LOC108676300 [Hyalella azteca]|uniref:m7GpppN-mRNA hydrolase NUDT17 n=1 Tax=Hyalella azteca TaxID=294128 RepID=A0A8B7P1L1_HYAAZ|nr:uncharacterized protein LOC108676300 [Hyalella azteca]
MGLTDWWQSKHKGPDPSTSPSPAEEGEENLDIKEFQEPFQSQAISNVTPDENKNKPIDQPAQKKGFAERFSFFKKQTKEVEIPPMDSEDVFSNIKKPTRKEDTNTKKGKKSKAEDNAPDVNDMVRIKVWLRRNKNDSFRPAKFCDCLVDYFASADQRNIYSAPSIIFTSNQLQIPQARGNHSSQDLSETSSLHSSSEYLAASGLSTPFGCCSVGHSPMRLNSRPVSMNSCCKHAPKTEAISVSVECILQDNRVLMQPAAEGEIVQRHRAKIKAPRRRAGSSVSCVAVLEHPPFCCAHRISPKDFTALPLDDKQRGVDVGVAVLLESSDERILITRRAQHMRTFPGVWVPPGGHIEDGESIIEAGMREVFEETALRLVKGKHPESVFLQLPNEDGSSQDMSNEITNEDSNINCYRVLGLWESCFPPVLYAGTPKRQHLVYYLHVLVSQRSEDIEPHIKLERSEVGASTWLNRLHAEVVAYSSRPLPDKPIPIKVLNPDTGASEPGVMDPKVLRKKMPEPTREIERLTTGTRFAFKLWLGMKEEEEEMSTI